MQRCPTVCLSRTRRESTRSRWDDFTSWRATTRATRVEIYETAAKAGQWTGRSSHARINVYSGRISR